MFFTTIFLRPPIVQSDISCDHNCHGDDGHEGGGRRRGFRAGPEQRGQYEGLDVVGVALLPDADAVALAVASQYAVVEGEVAGLGAALVLLRVVECSCHGR